MEPGTQVIRMKRWPETISELVVAALCIFAIVDAASDAFWIIAAGLLATIMLWMAYTAMTAKILLLPDGKMVLKSTHFWSKTVDLTKVDDIQIYDRQNNRAATGETPPKNMVLWVKDDHGVEAEVEMRRVSQPEILVDWVREQTNMPLDQAENGN